MIQRKKKKEPMGTEQRRRKMAAQSRTPRKTLISNEYCCASNCLCITTTYSFTDLLCFARCYGYSLSAILNKCFKPLRVLLYINSTRRDGRTQFKVWNVLWINCRKSNKRKLFLYFPLLIIITSLVNSAFPNLLYVFSFPPYSWQSLYIINNL